MLRAFSYPSINTFANGDTASARMSFGEIEVGQRMSVGEPTIVTSLNPSQVALLSNFPTKMLE
jgi:hypothetical protein